MSAAITRMCAECARDFEHTGTGRPPARCPRCRRQEQNGRAPRARVPLAPVSVPKAPAEVAPAVAAGTLDIAAIQLALAGEIEQLEQLIVVRLRVQRALESLATLQVML